ncbi:hypothetical protein EJ02DRAFT_511670 [Clathrospora elynae]|uniref:Uncharacterized protein n=1 Tax=Clathrospora elynae TaxID=706981 RepID=A0A6A5SVF4_9PLEO|nr:hypothetical protein EJ02DRAFT_511670 [Clathrospora elynae]
MTGCCLGPDTQDSQWTNSCVEYIEACGADCLANSFLRKCTNIASPYCVTWSYSADWVTEYGCTTTSRNTVYNVLQSAMVVGTVSVELLTLSGGAVTGFDESTFDGSLTDTDTDTGTYAVAFTTGDAAKPTDMSYTGGYTDTKPKKKVALGLIIGIVMAVLFLLFCVIVGVLFLLKKKKKKKKKNTLQCTTPAFAQAYGSPNAPPVPGQNTGYAQYGDPMGGAHEVEAGGVGGMTAGRYQSPVVGTHEGGRPVYEIGMGQGDEGRA